MSEIANYQCTPHGRSRISTGYQPPKGQILNVGDLTGKDLDQYVSKAMGHVGYCEISFHTSGEIALQLYSVHGESLQRFADGFYCTMRNYGKMATQNAKDPITAIYRAYIASRLGEEVG